MISRDYVKRKVMMCRVDLNETKVDALIDDAVRLLGNLDHYKHGGIYEDDDVALVAMIIGQDCAEVRL